MKAAEENLKKLQMKIKITHSFFLVFTIFLLSACQLFQNAENEDNLDEPKNLSEEQLQDIRYKFKRDKSYKQKSLYQNKTDSVVITIYNVIPYQVRDEQVSNIGEGFIYYIFDISVDNPTNKPFNIENFSKSCRLTNDNPDYLYSNIGYALKMFYLQSDSAEIDMEYTKRFYLSLMPPKEFYRTRLFAFEVSKDDKNPLYFRYNIGNQTYSYKVRDKQY